MTKTRVMLFSSSFLPKAGGLQYELKWFLDSLDRWVLDQDEFEFSFVSPGKSSLEYINFENIQTFDLDFDEFKPRGFRTTLRSVFNLRKIIRRNHPDIIHCQAVLPDAGLVWLATFGLINRPKIVVTSHGQDIVLLPEFNYGSRQNRRMDSIIKFFAGRMDAHVLPSFALAQFADDIGADPKKRTIIPNGLPMGNEPDFEYGPEADLNQDLVPNSFSAEPLSFLSLSSGRPIKNLDVLVEAFAQAHPSLGKSRLRLACIGSPAVHIHDLVDKLDIRPFVDFIGEVSGREKREVFRSSDVYCQTSHFENSPVSLLESMKFGLAVIASNVGGVPEMIKHEHNGLLVDQNDVDNVSSALVRILKDRKLRESLIENGREVVANHSMYRTIDQYVEVYRLA